MDNSVKFKKILIAPLDWGLGHATRCIPLIKYLLELNCEVTIAASNPANVLLKAEFPQLRFLPLNGYNIVYSKKKRWMAFKILIQIPKILKAIKLEHMWLRQFLETEQFNAVISDNRYGLFTNNAVCVFITHQLQVKTTLNIAKKLVRALTYKRINKFTECWVPDFEGELNIAGKLSHPSKLPKIPVKYLGPVSRFKPNRQQKTLYKYLIIITGPEPQRTIFEKKVFEFVKTSKEIIVIVRGKPEEKNSFEENFNCKTYNHLATKELADAFNSSEFIISRCGYTSVMEILSLKKKSILIPTPGQTEQEYLAKHLMKQNWCYSFQQNQNFATNIIKAQNFRYNLPEINTNSYETILDNFISTL